MRRRTTPLRALMVRTGAALLIVYLLVAAAGYRLLLALWELRPNPARAVAYFLVATLLVGYLSYRLGTASLLRDLDTAEISRGDAPGLYHRIDRLREELDVGDVTLYAAGMDAPNALALGTARGGAVVVDYGLFRLFSAAELEAVVPHELAHLEWRDGLVQTLGYTALRTVGGVLYVALLPVGIVAGGVLRALSWVRGRPPRPFLQHLALVQLRVAQVVILLLFALTLALRAHARRREYAADDRAVAATGDPIALARALVKIQRAADPRWGILSPLYIHGDEAGLLTRLLATHPPMEDRIQRLVRTADERAAPRQSRRVVRR
jgi:heat shock protein HtpX